MDMIVIGVALSLVNLALMGLLLWERKQGRPNTRSAPQDVEPLREMRQLAESAFTHLRATSASDAAAANATRIQAESSTRVQETLASEPPPEKTALEQLLADSRAGTLASRGEDGQIHVLEPIHPGDAI